jgi:hypothetical protein
MEGSKAIELISSNDDFPGFVNVAWPCAKFHGGTPIVKVTDMVSPGLDTRLYNNRTTRINEPHRAVHFESKQSGRGVEVFRPNTDFEWPRTRQTMSG